jgi:hypothetical protein
MKHLEPDEREPERALCDDLGLRRLSAEPHGTERSLQRIERNMMERIDRPASRLRALALATPARVAGTFLLGGLALGAGTVVALDQLGLSVVHIGGEEYVQVETPNPGERVLLPVAPGEGQGLIDVIEGGGMLLGLPNAPVEPPSIEDPPSVEVPLRAEEPRER